MRTSVWGYPDWKWESVSTAGIQWLQRTSSVSSQLSSARMLQAIVIFVILDILANAGGVTVSNFEWVQNVQKLFWTENDVNQSIDQIMTRAFHEVHDTSVKEEVNMRTAAYMLAIGRVAKAKRLRGIFP